MSKKYYSENEIFYFDEDKLNLWYSEVNEKGLRPYVLLFVNKNKLVFMPLMSKYDSKGNIRIKSEQWVEVMSYSRPLSKYVDGFALTDRHIYWTKGKLEYCIKNNLVKPTNYKVKGKIYLARLSMINFYKKYTDTHYLSSLKAKLEKK